MERNKKPDIQDKLPVIWTVSITRLSRLLHDVTPEFDDRADIENIHLGFEQAVTNLRSRLKRDRCDVVIAAGSNGAYLRGRIDRPVVLVRPDGFDLMQALSDARRSASKIGLVTHQTEVPAFTDFQKSFGLDVHQRAFATAEEARARVRELVANGCGAIVGTGMAADLAEQAGVAGILLYSADTVRQAMSTALQIATAVGRSSDPQRSARPARRGRPSPAKLLGDSQLMYRLRQDIERFAPTERTVLICGETGTGKELAAQALHAGSPRRKSPFVAVNCGAIAESLLESELFGYEEGAFTGARRGGHVGLIESAQGGTLFLDEIGEMPLGLQTRLLRMLEEREVLKVGANRPSPVDVRVIAATHGDLAQMCTEGTFRRDLFYRLNVLRLELPPLRSRGQDILQLATHFLGKTLGRDAPTMSDALQQALRSHPWPGNVRELRNLMDRLAVFCEPETDSISQPLAERCLPELFAAPVMEGPAGGHVRRGRRPEGAALIRALEQADGDRQLLARRLGVSRTTLWRWLRDVGQAHSRG